MSVWLCVPASSLNGTPVFLKPQLEAAHSLPAWTRSVRCDGSWMQIALASQQTSSANRLLTRMILLRREMVMLEREDMKSRLGTYWSNRGAMSYGVLKHTLHEAHDDTLFRQLALGRASREPGMWLEFGVFRGTSANITAAYRDILWRSLGRKQARAAGREVVGFDTFTGLPEEWMDDSRVSSGKLFRQKARRLYRRGSYSWAARSGGRPTPPVKPGIRLIVGLFNETLAPFLATRPAAPLAWVNIDCDLYAGAHQALQALAGRLVVGSRVHFHELLQERWAWRRLILEHKLGKHRPLPVADEMRALHQLLITHPQMQLEMRNVKSSAYPDAVAFVVRRPPGELPDPI